MMSNCLHVSNNTFYLYTHTVLPEPSLVIGQGFRGITSCLVSVRGCCWVKMWAFSLNRESIRNHLNPHDVDWFCLVFIPLIYRLMPQSLHVSVVLDWKIVFLLGWIFSSLLVPRFWWCNQENAAMESHYFTFFSPLSFVSQACKVEWRTDSRQSG